MTESLFEAENQMTRYLLGEMAEPERMALEEEYFADPQIFDRLMAIEHDLIEGYVCGKLSEADRKCFERRYMASAQRREHVGFFQTLAQTLPMETMAETQQMSSQPAYTAPLNKSGWWQQILPAWRWPQLAAGAALALALSSAWLAYETWQLRQQAEQQRIASQEREQKLVQQLTSERNNHEQQARELELMRQTQAAGADELRPQIASFVWTLSGLRATETAGETPRRLIIPANTDLAQLTFRLPGSRYAHYQVTLRAQAGRVIWQRDHLKSSLTKSAAAVTVYVPATQMKPGAYHLTLSGVAKIGSRDDLGEFQIEVGR